MTHPDGRLQRLRPAIPRPDRVRMGWEVLVELSAALGHELGLHTGPMVLAQIAREVPFYAGVTHEEIGGLGVRWQERDAAASLRRPDGGPTRPSRRRPRRPTDGCDSAPTATCGRARSQSATRRCDSSLPADARLTPTDAERLGVKNGQPVEARSNGHSLRAHVAIRQRMRPGAGFLIEGTAENNPSLLAGADEVEVRALTPEEEAAR